MVVIGGCRFGITSARPNCRAVNGTTAASCAPSRTCRCQSSGRRSVSVCWVAVTAVPQLRVECGGVAQQVHGVAHPEAGHLGRHVSEPALAFGRREVDVHPGHRRLDELAEEARRQDVVALVVERALQDVGGGALEFRVEILVHREAPDALAAVAARPLQPVVQARDGW